MTDKEDLVSILRLYYTYDPCTGSVKTKRSGRDIRFSSLDQGRYFFKIHKNAKYKRLPVVKVAYALHTGEYPKEQVITRNLDMLDLRESNLLKVSENDLKMIRFLLLNLRKHCKVRTSKNRKPCVRLYMLNKRMKSVSFDTQEAASKYVRRIKHRLYKQLEKLGIDINSDLIYKDY